MRTETRVVTNRVFLLGLDKLYRDAMKQHERGELLRCARRVATALQEKPADVPVEGYYADDEELTEYFLLIRALQGVDEDATPKVDSLPAFRRLRDVASAPLYGRPQDTGKLLPVGQDALSQALTDTAPEWTIASVSSAACRASLETDDISLVGVAARARDPVVLTALRESVVLHAEWIIMCDPPRRPRPTYVWQVDEDLARQSRRFVGAFNALFHEELPPPEPAQARRYWLACDDNKIVGRCVRLGMDPIRAPDCQYHWAIHGGGDDEDLAVQEFWHSELWTTARYRSALGGSDGQRLEL